jgi:hypothetical protein
MVAQAVGQDMGLRCRDRFSGLPDSARAERPSYMTGLHTRVAALLASVRYKGLWEPFRVHSKGASGGDIVLFIQHAQFLPDASGALRNAQWQTGRKWYISTHMTDGEILQTALRAILDFEEHEAREGFEFCGERLFSPHKSVRALLNVEEEKRA